MLTLSAEVDRRRSETNVAMRNELLKSHFELNALSAEVDRKRVESNELSRYKRVEAKEKNKADKSVSKQLDDELRLELMAEVDRKELIKLIRSKEKNSQRK